MTAPREDASALVARVRSEIGKLEAAQGDDGATSVGGWYALTGNGYIEAQVNETDLRALCALVEQGEGERRRLAEWAPFVRNIAQTRFPKAHELADLLAALPPNDSAARTGQEG